MMGIRDKIYSVFLLIKNHKVITAIALIILVAIVVVASTFSSVCEEDRAIEAIEQMGNGEFLVGKNFSFRNSDELYDSVPERISFKIYDNMQEIVLDDEEIKSSPNDNDSESFPKQYYIGNMNNFNENSSDRIFTLSYGLTVSDGRSYDVYAFISAPATADRFSISPRDQGADYIATLMIRTDTYVKPKLIINHQDYSRDGEIYTAVSDLGYPMSAVEVVEYNFDSDDE